MTFIGFMHISLELWGGIFCLLASLSTWIIGENKNRFCGKMFLLLVATAVLLFSDAMAWGFRGHEGLLGYYMVRISNFMVFATTYMISVIYTGYMEAYLEERGQVANSWCRLVNITGLIGIAFLILSQFSDFFYYFDDLNYYHRGRFYWVGTMIGLLQLGFYFFDFASCIKKLTPKEQVMFGSYVGIPAVALMIQNVCYGISVLNICIMVMVLIIYMNFLVERSVYLAEQDRKMSDMQVQLILSQIQPHFIYNSLNSIYYLCEKDSKKAQEAIGWFADLLRSNMDSMKRNMPIPFGSELKSLGNYLKLEKMRFDEELQTEYDIKAINFMVPPMTLQPIVENAVKHGICPKPGGGTITISSEEKEDFFEVVVKDDGVGYNPDKNKNDGRTHTGVDSVRNRLWSMCKATMEISGKEGEGTIVVIHVPKDKEAK